MFTLIEYKHKDLFNKSHIDKQLKISTDDGIFVATNSDIKQENFNLKEILCDKDELRFGQCLHSEVKFQIRNAFIPLSGKWLTVTETLDGNTDVPFQYGRYKVFSDVPTADKEYRDITAYDAMYDILNADMAAWYNSVLPNENSTVTLRQFRTSFIRHFGLTEVVPEGGLVNDSMVVERTIQPEQISGKDIIIAICEINGCFGHIGRDGKFHYIYLPQAIEGLYPANDLYPDHAPEWMVQAKTGHLYPQDPKSTALGIGRYIKCQYEDYTTKRIAKLQIRQKENDIGIIWPNENSVDSDNCYIIEDNFLVYGKTHGQLSEIAQNIFRKITDIIYRPFDCTAVGNPCLEVGDPVRLPTKYKIVESYILERNLKGIQSLRDIYTAKGKEKYAEKLNGIQKSIIQLKGKTNTLERTIDETRLEMEDMEDGLSNEISVTAGQIRTELQNTKSGLETQISATAEGIKTEVSKTYETKSNAQSNYSSLSSNITQTANSIKTEVSEKYETKNAAQESYRNLSSSITQTAGEIKTEVSSTYETKNNAKSNYDSLSSSITVNANNIALKVSKGNVSSQISAEAGSVAIKSNRMTIEADNFKLSGSGSVSAKGEVETVQENGVSAKLKGNGLSISDAIGVQIGKYTATYNSSYPNDYSRHGIAIVTATGNVGIGVEAGSKANIYYYMNNGSNPNGLTERHLFNQEARFINSAKFPKVILANTSSEYGNFTGGTYGGSAAAVCNGGFYVYGSIGCSGTKNRIVDTKNYGTVGMNAFETAGAYFSDIGSGHIEVDKCYIYLDPTFMEVIDTNEEYQVLITRTSRAETSWVEKHEGYFIVHGEPGASFDWMVMAKQKTYQMDRMESIVIESEAEIPYDESIFYGDDAPQATSERYMYELEDTLEEDAMQYIRDFTAIENEIIEGVI